jgi:ribonuclease III
MKLLNEYDIDFSSSKLINDALTHTSYANEHNVVSYERLEYLGDAVLELVCSDYLFKKGNYEPGEMSKMRSLYVCENALFEYSKEIHLDSYIRLGNGISYPNKTVIADVFEAVIAVIYLEYGLDKVRNLFNKLIVPYIESDVDFIKDYKSSLQEYLQTKQKSVTYELVKETGPAHNKVFTVNVLVEGLVFGSGKGKSKKEAEQRAAKDAFSKCAK